MAKHMVNIQFFSSSACNDVDMTSQLKFVLPHQYHFSNEKQVKEIQI